MKQLVCEFWSVKNGKKFDLLDIKMKYPKNCFLFKFLSEREECEKNWKNGILLVLYWINVADNPQTENFQKPVKMTRQQILAEKRAKKLEKLRQEKKERIQRYAEMAELEMEIQPTSKDISSAMDLQDLIGREKKTLPSQVLANMAEFIEQKDERVSLETPKNLSWMPASNDEDFVKFAKNGGIMYRK